MWCPLGRNRIILFISISSSSKSIPVSQLRLWWFRLLLRWAAPTHCLFINLEWCSSPIKKFFLFFYHNLYANWFEIIIKQVISFAHPSCCFCLFLAISELSRGRFPSSLQKISILVIERKRFFRIYSLRNSHHCLLEPRWFQSFW